MLNNSRGIVSPLVLIVVVIVVVIALILFFRTPSTRPMVQESQQITVPILDN